MNATAAAFPDRDSVADKLSAFKDHDRATLALLMENAAQDENLLEGLHRFLDLSAKSRMLNALKLETIGEWLGNNAPARLQIRLMEVSRSSQHAAHQSFRTGLVRSGGLERSYPKV